MSIIAKLLERITGKDDLERVACKGNLNLLNDYLRTRSVFIPKKPRRFLDAATFTQAELLEMTEAEMKELAGDRVELWILELDGKKRLPIFSSRKKMEAFSARVSQDMNKVFPLGCVKALLPDVTKKADVDFVDLNLFSEKSWEIEVRKQSDA